MFAPFCHPRLTLEAKVHHTDQLDYELARFWWLFLRCFVGVTMAEAPANPATDHEKSIVFNEFQHLNEFYTLFDTICSSVGDVRKEEMLLTKFSSLLLFPITWTY